MFAYLKRFLFFILLLSSSFAFSASFSSSEHLAAGDNINLQFNNKHIVCQACLLHLPNGLQLSYGDILTFGDLYGIPEQAISLGKSADDKLSRFLAAFATFALNTTAITEATQLTQVIRGEKKLIDDAMNHGEEPEQIYARVSNETGRQLNCITGGGCMTNGWWLIQGRYLQLAADNFDHFGKNALIAYEIGHAAAIHQALNAGATNDISGLELAYAMNAFASHFLSDLFAAGHIRPPREEMSTYVSPSILGSLLVNFMHNEENAAGLHVHNKRGDHWIAYGDRSYFSKKNNDGRNILHEALQLSADEIYAAYQEGKLPIEHSISNLIPIADETAENTNQDVSPLFYWDEKNKVLMRRSDLSNPYDHHWTANWWGWSTLADLSKQRGIPSSLKAALVH